MLILFNGVCKKCGTGGLSKGYILNFNGKYYHHSESCAQILCDKLASQLGNNLQDIKLPCENCQGKRFYYCERKLSDIGKTTSHYWCSHGVDQPANFHT